MSKLGATVANAEEIKWRVTKEKLTDIKSGQSATKLAKPVITIHNKHFKKELKVVAIVKEKSNQS